MAKPRSEALLRASEIRASRRYFVEELQTLGMLAGKLGYTEAEQFIQIALEAVHDQSQPEASHDCCS